MRKNDDIHHSEGFNISHIKWKKNGMFTHKNSGIDLK